VSGRLGIYASKSRCDFPSEEISEFPSLGEIRGPSSPYSEPSFTWGDRVDKILEDRLMVNYILLYKIRKRVKKILKDKIADEELATTKTSCLGCLADDISWEIYYLLKEKEEPE
jgi:hypothetical protein